MKQYLSKTGSLFVTFLTTSCALIEWIDPIYEETAGVSKPSVCQQAWVGTQQLGTSGDDRSYGITFDSSCKLYITGSTYGALDGQTNNGNADMFIVKYDEGGNKQWTRLLGAGNYDSGNDIIADSAGNIYVTGQTSGTAGVTTFDGSVHFGIDDIFLVKYDASGNKQWTRLLGSTGSDIGESITVDSSGNLYVTGSWSSDMLLVKYDPNGNQLWTRTLGSAGPDTGHSITADPAGNIYVTGKINGSMGSTFDGQNHSGSDDMLLVKYDSNGNKQWTRLLGTNNFENGKAITADTAGNIYVTGQTSGTAGDVFDGQTHNGSDDMLLVKYDSNGNKQWTRLLGTNATDIGLAITTDSAGHLYVTGQTDDSLDGQPHSGVADIFFVKYDASGNKYGTRQLGTIGSDIGYSLTTDPDGLLYVTGETGDSLDGQPHSGNDDIFIVKYDANGNKF